MKADFPSESALQSAASLLQCEVAAIKAVARVEAGSEGAFLENGEPVILYEAHVFDRLTGGKFRGVRAMHISGEPGILSREHWTLGTYGSYSIQHARLNAAAELDRTAALKSCSWGLFQILGENYKRAGFKELQAFINAMYRDVNAHLTALCCFILTDERLLAAIRARDWVTFARIYNGPGYRRNRYDEKLAAEFGRF